MEGLLHFLLIHHIQQLDVRMVFQTFQVFPDLFLHDLIIRILQFNVAGQAVGMGKAVAVDDLSVLAADESGLGQQDIHVDDIFDVRLAVVAHDDDVGILQIAIASHAFHQHTEFLVVLTQLLLGVFMVDTVLVTDAVQIAHLDQHDVRLAEVPDQVRSDGHGQQVQGTVPAFYISSIFPVIGVEKILRGVAVFQILQRIVAIVMIGNDHRPVIGVVSTGGNRPAQRTGRQAMLTGIVQQRRIVYFALVAEPGVVLFTVQQAFIGNDAVSVNIGTRKDGSMTAVCQRRMHRQKMADI